LPESTFPTTAMRRSKKDAGREGGTAEASPTADDEEVEAEEEEEALCPPFSSPRCAKVCASACSGGIARPPAAAADISAGSVEDTTAEWTGERRGKRWEERGRGGVRGVDSDTAAK
jgi:hypothetical protein